MTLIVFTLGVFSYAVYLIPSKNQRSMASQNIQTSIDASVNTSLNTSLSNQGAVSSQTFCHNLKQTYSNLEELKNNQKLDVRFNNIHKKIGSQIYRLRSFFKDGDEGEIETYLVYLEDSLENAKIIEKSSYKKGKLFLKIESLPGETIYHEEGLNLGDNLFLHYVNNQLMSAHGLKENSNKKFVDCRFQQV